MSRAITVAAGAGDVQGVTGPATLYGFSVRETGGTQPGQIQLRDGTDTSGQIKVTMGVLAAGAQSGTLPAVEFTTGIFVDRTGTGTTELVLYI